MARKTTRRKRRRPSSRQRHAPSSRSRRHRSWQKQRQPTWRHYVVWMALLAGLVIIYWLLPGSYEGITGVPRYIADGDSFTLCEDDECTRIRLCGINAPEIGDPGGNEARAAMKRLIGGEEVYCIRIGDGTVCDQLSKHYDKGRTVAQCYVGKRDIAEEQVRAGHACDLPRFSDGHYGALPGACSE